jgi:CDGSH-type Zn-finger protein
VQESWLRGIINRFSLKLKYQMRVQTNPEDIGRCGCGRREYCDGSHGLTEAQWQEVQAKEQEAAQKNTRIANQEKDAT